MSNPLDEFILLSTKLRKDWLQTDKGMEFQTNLVEYPIVAMYVDIDDIFEERTNNFSDYDHGLFFYDRSISEERRSMIEEGAPLTDEEKIQFREFMLTSMIGEEIFDEKVTVARWADIKKNDEKLGAVFYGSDSPFWGSSYGFLGIFKNHDEVKAAMSGFGEEVAPSHYY